MNRIFYIGAIFLSSGIGTIFANAFDDANRQYQSGNFSEAVAAYENILINEGPRAAVFYNLGNSYQSLKLYGLAILAYERACLLTPRDSDLLANLALARKAALPAEAKMPPRFEAVITYLSRDEWSWLLAGASLVLGGAIFLYGMVRLPIRMCYLITSFGGVAVFLIFVGAWVLYLRRDESSRGIVLLGDAAVRLSPFEKAESLGTPGLGKVVRLGARKGDFQYAEVPGTSLRGWLANKDVGAIESE